MLNEDCGNGVDDNGDGYIDEVCAAGIFGKVDVFGITWMMTTMKG